MKKFRYLVVLAIVAIAGFALGRATGTSGVPSIANIHRDFPLFPAPPKPTPAAPKIETPVKVESDIVLEEPPDGMRPEGVTFQVSGRAKTGGSPIRVTVNDAQSAQLFTQIVTVTAAAGEEYGRFSLSVTLPALPTAPVTLIVKRDGQEGVETVERILVYGASDDIPVKVYFSKSDSDECGLVYPIERMVAGRIAVYRVALEELLRGPNADDVAAGYRTSIPGGVKLKSVAADAAGTVTADFDDRLSRGVAGSCRIESIRAQIGATLKQFPEVHDVVISINGKTEGILEP